MVRSEILLVFFIIFIILITIYFSPTRLVSRREHIVSKIKPCIDRIQSIKEIRRELVAKPENYFTLGMLLADDIDHEFVPDVFRHLTTAMELIQQEDRINDDHEFMVRRAGDIQQIGMMNGANDFELGLALDAAINGANRIVKVKSTENRLELADKAPNIEEKRAVLFAPTFTSDTQNTHERGVLNDTAVIIAMLKADNNADKKDIETIAREISEYSRRRLPADKQRRIEIALNKARAHIDIFALGDNEANILAMVWMRASHANNRANKEVMREAVCDALADCVDAQTMIPVCVSGRATRIVGALATLDFDKRASIVMTHEMYKNEILNDTKTIIEYETKGARDSGGEMAQFADDYEAGEEGDNAFTAMLRAKIEENIANYSAKLDVIELMEIKKTCLIFAGL